MPARKSAAKKAAKKTARNAAAQPPGTRTQAAAPDGATVAEPAKSYLHPDAERPLVPEAGAMAAFKRTKPPREYRYDSSLAPELRWDSGEASARDRVLELLTAIERADSLEEVRAAAAELKAMNLPQLDWAGKAERPRFDVPTLPLFVHERLSTRAVLDSVRHRRTGADQSDLFDNPFGDERHGIADQVLRAYEHKDRWTNRMILGDSLVVMNSLLEYEGMGGQVQTIYMDPPYGVKYNSNFQPFIRSRSVDDSADADLTREPEMVQAYRDTWELGVHSYLAYLRDRLAVSRELLTPSGSIFIQISDENVHRVRSLLDEVFGAENFVALITVSKTSGLSSPQARTETLASTCDYLIWYARDRTRLKYRQLFKPKSEAKSRDDVFKYLELADGTRRPITESERRDRSLAPDGARYFSFSDLTAQKPTTVFPLLLDGRVYHPGRRGWRTTEEGMRRLMEQRRIAVTGKTPRFVSYEADFAAMPINSLWDDTGTGSFLDEKLYVVQTGTKTVARCILMTSDPGDIVLDPTCGSGTTAYVAEQWGRRWITIDTSRVPLALARQRLLTATYDWYELKDEQRGPASGFVYRRRQNNRGEEVGGIVPHITLRSIANDEPPADEVLVDRPEIVRGVTRVAGPFTVEATIPTPVDLDGDGAEDAGPEVAEQYDRWIDRLLDVLRRSPVIRLAGNREVRLDKIRPPARALNLVAEATFEGAPVAIVAGPEHGVVSEKLVFDALQEARLKQYTQLLVIGFGIEPRALALVDNAEAMTGVIATYVQATPDLIVGPLLKTMRSSQIFSVCGRPEIRVDRVPESEVRDGKRFHVTLLGVDVFDPAEMKSDHRTGTDVPCWMLDTDHDAMVFRASQVFFPRTEAWNSLARSLGAEYDPAVWAHLAGATSAPFAAPAGKARFTVAVKVIDDRGNELLVTKEVDA